MALDTPMYDSVRMPFRACATQKGCLSSPSHMFLVLITTHFYLLTSFLLVTVFRFATTVIVASPVRVLTICVASLMDYACSERVVICYYSVIMYSCRLTV